MNVLLLLLTVCLPWLVGWIILYRNKADPDAILYKHWVQIHRLWWVVLLLAGIPFFIWSGDESDSASSTEGVLGAILDRSSSAIAHVLRYLLPFAVFPTVIFWIKLVVNHRADAQEQQYGTEGLQRNSEQQRQQSQLITFTIKTLIMIFVFFGILTQIGINTDEVLNITTVFSLGVSWSMRDWLSSLWACFMLAFSTKLTCGMRLRLGCTVPEKPDKWFTVIRPGLLYTVCKADHDEQIEVYIPNSQLLTGGFVLG